MYSVLIPILRQLLLVAGGALATYGIIEQGQVEAFVGICISFGAALWRWIEMYRERRRKV